MSNPAVTFGCCLLASMVGRSSFHNGPLRARQPLQILRVLRIWGVGLLISSSENSVKAKFAFWGFSEVRIHGVLRSSHASSSRKTTLCTATVQHLWADPG